MPVVTFSDSAGNTIRVNKYGDRGYLGPGGASQEALDDMHNIDFRDDDVIVCSYPKSGCHWLWEMARMLRAGTTDVGTVDKMEYMIEMVPRSELEKKLAPRVFNCHVLFHQLPKKVQEGKVKLLFIYRNPKDVAVSFYNHHSNVPKHKYQGQFSDHFTGLFLKGHACSGDFFTYTRDWEAVMNSRPDLQIFTLSYEDLQADTFNKAKELAQFLGSSADDDTIQVIVNKCSFSSMRARYGHNRLNKDGEPAMYRKGKVGDWKNWFTVAQNEMFDDICQKELRGSTLKFRYTL